MTIPQILRTNFLLNCFILLSVVCLITTNAFAAEVVDGDTVNQNGVTYRLEGIDAHEHGQKWKSTNGKIWTCGKQATFQLKKLVGEKQISCLGDEKR